MGEGQRDVGGVPCCFKPCLANHLDTHYLITHVLPTTPTHLDTHKLSHMGAPQLTPLPHHSCSLTLPRCPPSHRPPQTVRNKGERLVSGFDVSSLAAVSDRLSRHGLVVRALYDGQGLSHSILQGGASSPSLSSSSPTTSTHLHRVSKHTCLPSLDSAKTVPEAVKTKTSHSCAIQLEAMSVGDLHLHSPAPAASTASAPAGEMHLPGACSDNNSNTAGGKQPKLKMPSFFHYIDAYKP